MCLCVYLKEAFLGRSRQNTSFWMFTTCILFIAEFGRGINAAAEHPLFVSVRLCALFKEEGEIYEADGRRLVCAQMVLDLFLERRI